jgi:hypothetical protein
VALEIEVAEGTELQKAKLVLRNRTPTTDYIKSKF